MNSSFLNSSRNFLFLFSSIIFLELIFSLIYVLYSGAIITDPLILLYPFIWINSSIFVLLRIKPTKVKLSKRIPAFLFGFMYFLLLAYLSSILDFGHIFHGHTASDHAFGLRIAFSSMPPGWAPSFFYSGLLVSFYILFFEFFGYLSLSYLFYRSMLNFNRFTFSGMIGLFSCIRCTWPLIGAYLSSISGSTLPLFLSAHQSYGFSTLIFTTVILLLFWGLPKRNYQRSIGIPNWL